MLLRDENRAMAYAVNKETREISTRISACGSKEFDPPFPFPQGESRGGDGSPHAESRSAPAKIAGTARAAAPPARGPRPLARSPAAALGLCRPSLVARKRTRDSGKGQRMAATSALTFMTFS